jgi:hypothetical protein
MIMDNAKMGLYQREEVEITDEADGIVIRQRGLGDPQN